MNEKAQKLRKSIGKYKYPLIVLLLGVVLLLIPSGSGGEDESEDKAVQSDEKRLETLLEDVSGVGEVEVLLSENGIVIVCSGADNAEVRLNVIKAACAFTGFSSDRIQVLKLVRSGK